MLPGAMPFFAVFSSVTQGPHQLTPNSSNSGSVVAPLMNAHSSPIGLRQNDLMLRSVITGNPWASGKVMVCCMTVSALTPCRVPVSIPVSRILIRTRRYSVDAGRWSYGRYSIARQLSGDLRPGRALTMGLGVGGPGDRGPGPADRDPPGGGEDVGDKAVGGGEPSGGRGPAAGLRLGAGEP